MNNIAIYIHWPFCKSKCPYCDFNSHVRDNIDQDKWLKSYLTEIDYFIDLLKYRNITSIFFGGGTPSLMNPKIVESIIDKLANISTIDDDIEITLEANPTSVESSKFSSLKLSGINRISIGIQSLNEFDLKFLGRSHSKNEAISAINTASKIFDNYSFDLIYSLPDQTLDNWRNELEFALSFASNHLSLYQLTIEKGTKFFSDYNKNKFIIPDDEQAASLYQLTQQIMNENNLPAYEVSNHAKIGSECKHNLSYWNYDDYLGIGPGAHSRTGGSAIMMIHNPENWMNSIEKNRNGIQNKNLLNRQEKIEEILIMGLRLIDGININNISDKMNINIIDQLNRDKLKSFIKSEFIELNDNLKITNNGRLLTNKIISELLSI